MRANFSPQSELGPLLMRFAPPYGLAARCSGHCNTGVARGVRAMLTRRHPHLPPG